MVDRIKANILTEETLRELVDLTNEELRVNQRRAANRLDRLDEEARSVEQKLSNLYSALESGKVDVDDLAPRLKELRLMQIELEDKGAEALEELDETDDNLIDPLVMDHYVEDLRSVLESASFMECKRFLRTFIRRIDFNKQQVGIEYTVPMLSAMGRPRRPKYFTSTELAPRVGFEPTT